MPRAPPSPGVARATHVVRTSPAGRPRQHLCERDAPNPPAPTSPCIRACACAVVARSALAFALAPSSPRRWRYRSLRCRRDGDSVGPLLVFDWENACRLTGRLSLGPRRFSVLARDLWNRNDGARGPHRRATFLADFFAAIPYIALSARARRGRAAALWLLAHPDDGSRRTAAQVRGGTHRGGARARSFCVEPCADVCPETSRARARARRGDRTTPGGTCD